MITVEYLLPFNTVDGICKDINSFKSLLTSNSKFHLEADSLIYEKVKYSFSVTLTEVPKKDCSVFHVTFGSSKLTDKFREMLRLFQKTIGSNLKDNIQVIWDGVSFEWSTELYPQIYQIENNLRKLISKFMLTKLGVGWYNSSIPKDVTESVKRESFKLSHNILYEVDFIQLANFLFKPYSIKDSYKLPEILKGIIESGMTEEKKKEILEYIPKNNWDRYFSEIVDYDSEKLKKNWESLYEIRCKVAHNRPMNFENFEKAKELCESLEKVFDKAVKSIDKIEIPEKDKENIGLKTIGTINDSTKYFVENYLNLTNNLSAVATLNKEKYKFISDINNPIQSILDSSYGGKINISDSLQYTLSAISEHKNMILSGITNSDAYKTVLNDNIFNVPKDKLNELIFPTAPIDSDIYSGAVKVGIISPKAITPVPVTISQTGTKE